MSVVLSPSLWSLLLQPPQETHTNTFLELLPFKFLATPVSLAPWCRNLSWKRGRLCGCFEVILCMPGLCRHFQTLLPLREGVWGLPAESCFPDIIKIVPPMLSSLLHLPLIELHTEKNGDNTSVYQLPIVRDASCRKLTRQGRMHSL